MSWTHERTEKLKELWAEGKSAAIIGNIIGKSKNAVVGKVHRLGLNGRSAKQKPTSLAAQQKIRQKHKFPKSRKVAQNSGKQAYPTQKIIDADKIYNRAEIITFENLQDHHCRWPIGEPKDKNFRFCGCKIEANSPYCKKHRIISMPRGNE